VDWYDQHRLAFVLPTTLGLTAFFISFAITSGFIWIPICFGVIAGLSFVTLTMKLIFPEFRRHR
jgi:hypothetical protein